MKGYLKKESPRIALALLFSIVGSVLYMLNGVLVGKIVDAATKTEFNKVITFSILNVAMFGIILFFNVLEKKYRQKFLMNVGNSLRFDMVESLLSVPMKDYKEKGFDYYFNTINDDVEMVMSSCLESGFMFIKHCIGILIFAGILFYYHPVLLLISVVLSVLPLALSYVLSGPMERVNSEKSQENERYLSNLNESLSGLEVVKRSGRSGKFLRNFKSSIDALGEKVNRMEVYSLLTERAMWSINSLIQTLIIAICSVLILKGQLTPGALVSSIVLVTSFSENITNAFVRVIDFNSAKGISDKIFEIIKSGKGQSLKYQQSPDSTASVPTTSVAIEDLGFSYGEKKIFDHLSLSIPNKECVAIIGKSGSGKTTLVNLMLKVLDDYKGKISIMGKDLRSVEEDELYDRVYLIPQEVFMFSESIFDNVSLFDERTEENVKRMLGILNELNIGYLVDEDGNDKEVDLGKLSGGEKKRIAIARGLYQNSGILIFDEPTAGLDPPQAKVINEIIFNLDDKLRIIITHNWDKEYLSRFDQVIDIERE